MSVGVLVRCHASCCNGSEAFLMPSDTRSSTVKQLRLPSDAPGTSSCAFLRHPLSYQQASCDPREQAFPRSVVTHAPIHYPSLLYNTTRHLVHINSVILQTPVTTAELPLQGTMEAMLIFEQHFICRLVMLGQGLWHIFLAVNGKTQHLP